MHARSGTSGHFFGTSRQCPELPEKFPELLQIAEKFQKFFINPKISEGN